MSIVESVQYNRNLATKFRSFVKLLTKRAVVASVSGSKVRLTEGNREVARLRGAPINPGDTVYLLNITGDNDNPGWLVIGAEGGEYVPVAVAGVIPNALGSTDRGFVVGSATPKALISEEGDAVVSLAINTPQVGTRSTSRVGGILRLDSRAGSPRYTIIAYPAGGSAFSDRFVVDLQIGETYLVPSGGNVAVGPVFPPSARLHISAGGAAAGSAPVKLTSGAFLTTPEAGAFEFAGGYLWFTSVDGVRKAVSLSDHTHTAASLGRLAKRLGANQAIVPPAAVGTTSSIPDLVLPIAPGETWAFEFSLSTYCNGAGGLRVGMSYPADATVSADVIGSGSATNVTDTVNEVAAVYILNKSFNAYAGSGWIKIFGSVVCGATASNVSLRWQRMVAGESAVIDAGSILRAERVN